jgi:hypothetical protein
MTGSLDRNQQPIARIEGFGRPYGEADVPPNDGLPPRLETNVRPMKTVTLAALADRDRNRVTAFARYIGIDYSGAQTPSASLKGLRVYMAEAETPPIEVVSPPSPRKYRTRRGIAEWLVDRLIPGIIGRRDTV